MSTTSRPSSIGSATRSPSARSSSKGSAAEVERRRRRARAAELAGGRADGGARKPTRTRWPSVRRSSRPFDSSSTRKRGTVGSGGGYLTRDAVRRQRACARRPGRRLPLRLHAPGPRPSRAGVSSSTGCATAVMRVGRSSLPGDRRGVRVPRTRLADPSAPATQQCGSITARLLRVRRAREDEEEIGEPVEVDARRAGSARRASQRRAPRARRVGRRYARRGAAQPPVTLRGARSS